MTHPCRHPAAPARRGFTLTEMLVVISIIVLLLAVAVPTFRYITGSRSIDSAQNLVAAMLNRARAEAVRTKQKTGVAFFRDYKSDRTMMALVSLSSVTSQTNVEPAGMEQYRAWQATTATNTVTYSVGDVVCYAGPRAVPSGENKKVVRLFICKKAITNSSTANNPPDPWTPTSNTYWGEIQGSDMDAFQTVDTQSLPIGIGVQLVNDPRGVANTDRYVRFGIILFDSTGRLSCEPFTVQRVSNLGQLIGLSADLQDPTGAAILYTQLGVALYEDEPFRNNSGFTEGDFATNSYFNTSLVPSPTAYSPSEQLEESWIDQNGLVLLVDRSSGALTKGE